MKCQKCGHESEPPRVRPTKGRVVLYSLVQPLKSPSGEHVSHPNGEWPAIVVDVGIGSLTLAVLTPLGVATVITTYRSTCDYGGDLWRWPPRETA